jgi:predicted ribosomally synthesized peptide with SipW-like signal peptide
MKKKVSIIVTATLLVALIVVGSTLAFFTSQGTVNNVITMGDVKISLTEPSFKDSGIVPGETIEKIPTVKNEGSKDAYIRCKIALVVPEAATEEETSARKAQLLRGITFGDASISGSADKWVQSGDYYYYQDIVPANAIVEFFHSVTVPEVWDNAFADQQFQINVTAEAIQADNFTPTRNAETKITAWNYSDNTPVPIESSPNQLD